MNYRFISLLTFIVSTSLCGMNKPIPPAKEGVNALVNYVLKKCGLTDINNDETEKVINAFTEIALTKESDIHELVQNENFVTLAKRAAEKEYLVSLALLDAMKSNTPQEIRALLKRCEKSTPIKTIAKAYLDEETEENDRIVEYNRKK